MAYQHLDIELIQSSKQNGAPCGDAFSVRRTPYHTTCVLCDGIGSGIRAHVASQMNLSRLDGLLRLGRPLREAFLSVVGTMSAWRDHSMPFSAFLLARMLSDGGMSVLTYEMPGPILVSPEGIEIIKSEPLTLGAGMAYEHHFHLSAGDGVLLLSDGVTQAGMGRSSSMGWGLSGVAEFLRGYSGRSLDFTLMARETVRHADLLDGSSRGDDRTLVMAHARIGQGVDLFTGPPKDKESDELVARNFLEADGFKIICGCTSAEVVSRYHDEDLEIEQQSASYSTPPRYFMKGIDLVTEGAVTLTQVYNLLGEDVAASDDRSAAADLTGVLAQADWVRFHVGLAKNPANADIVYRKQGILSRERIVPLIASKLEQMGKLVSVNYF